MQLAIRVCVAAVPLFSLVPYTQSVRHLSYQVGWPWPCWYKCRGRSYQAWRLQEDVWTKGLKLRRLILVAWRRQWAKQFSEIPSSLFRSCIPKYFCQTQLEKDALSPTNVPYISRMNVKLKNKKLRLIKRVRLLMRGLSSQIIYCRKLKDLLVATSIFTRICRNVFFVGVALENIVANTCFFCRDNI